MKTPVRILILCALAATARLGGSIPVPQDLRNPFEPPDPRTTNPAPKTANPQQSAAAVAADTREATFSQVQAKLRALPVRGVVANLDAPGNSTALVGPYIIKRNTSLPPSDFGVSNAFIKIVSVDPDEMVVLITIDLETKKVTIPLR